MSRVRGVLLTTMLLSAASCGGPRPQPPQAADQGRYLVYFEPWSADLSPDAASIVAQAAARAKALGATGIRVEARASAVGSADANQKLAATRAALVSDTLTADGVARGTIRQVPIGLTGSGDPGVMDRRVDIVLEK